MVAKNKVSSRATYNNTALKTTYDQTGVMYH